MLKLSIFILFVSLIQRQHSSFTTVQHAVIVSDFKRLFRTGSIFFIGDEFSVMASKIMDIRKFLSHNHTIITANINTNDDINLNANSMCRYNRPLWVLLQTNKKVNFLQDLHISQVGNRL